MFVVITKPKLGQQQVYGPFAEHLSATDFAHVHYDETAEPTLVRPVNNPPTYGEEGL